MRLLPKTLKSTLPTADYERMARETEGLKPPPPEKLLNCGDGVCRSIIKYPDGRLQTKCEEVEFGEPLRKVIADLAATFYSTKAFGLSAPQIGVPARVFLVDIHNSIAPQKDRSASQLLVAINPEIWPFGPVRKDAERCSSFPDHVELIARPARVVLKAYTLEGVPFALACGGALGRTIQHEYDHLEGTLIIDNLSGERARDVRQAVAKECKWNRGWRHR